VKVGHVEPFVLAAMKVFEAELGASVTRGELALDRSGRTTNEITVLITISGEIEGTVLYGVEKAVANRIASALLGEPKVEFDEMSESAVAELGNIISGQAAIALERAGTFCTLSPPSVIVGTGTKLPSVEAPMLIVPIQVEEYGTVRIALSILEKLVPR